MYSIFLNPLIKIDKINFWLATLHIKIDKPFKIAVLSLSETAKKSWESREDNSVLACRGREVSLPPPGSCLAASSLSFFQWRLDFLPAFRVVELLFS